MRLKGHDGPRERKLQGSESVCRFEGHNLFRYNSRSKFGLLPCYITGTVPMTKDALLGDRLEAASSEALGKIPRTYQGSRSLGESVARYVELARSRAILEGADREGGRAE